ncbi:hypothetical protein PFLUV_G00190480 [Perca fluviatilis]|uniref:Uncharacterized protein n=1 Tax=Perca fluviatilis TaxID=8168 RepID=A0A6A5DVJ3_PERFL|nr:hypothetical protein PFLUV_G00190480 [Perca fluviatilis]
MGFNRTLFIILSFFFIFLGSSVYISGRPVSYNTGNNRNISCDEERIGAENQYNVKDDTEKKISLGNISNIHISGTNHGCIGGRNNYTVTGQIAAKSNIGNVSNVTVGNNSGSIGSGNRINIS